MKSSTGVDHQHETDQVVRDALGKVAVRLKISSEDAASRLFSQDEQAGLLFLMALAGGELNPEFELCGIEYCVASGKFNLVGEGVSSDG